jgi:hypothetical protein
MRSRSFEGDSPNAYNALVVGVIEYREVSNPPLLLLFTKFGKRGGLLKLLDGE